MRLLGVGIVFVAVVALWYSWMTRDQGLPRGDENRYLAAAERARAVMDAPPAGALATLRALGDVHPTHPPLFPVTAGAVMKWSGPALERVMPIQLAYLLLLLVAVYNAGRVLSSRRRGLAAAFLTAGFPLVFRYTHEFFLALPTAAFVAWAMWLMLAWRSHGGWHRALLLGVVFGLGLLTKWTFVVFVGMPAIFLLDRLRHHRDLGAVEVWFGFGLGVLIALPWYVTHFDRVRAFVDWNREQPFWHLADPNTASGWLFYVERLPHMMGGIGAVLLLIGIGAALVRTRREGVVLAWLLVPLIVFTILGTKDFDGRHLLPALPAAALLGALCVTAPWAPARLLAWLLVLAAVPLNLIPAAGLGLRDTLRGVVPGTAYSIVGLYQEPEANDFGAEAVYNAVAPAAAGDGRVPDVFTTTAYRSLTADGLNYLAQTRGAPLTAFNPEPRAAGETVPDPQPLWRRILGADHVVVKTGLGVESNVNGYRDAMVAWWSFFAAESVVEALPYEVRKVIFTPDGDQVRVLVRVGKIEGAAEEAVLRRFLAACIEASGRPRCEDLAFRSALERLGANLSERGKTRPAGALRDLAEVLAGPAEEVLKQLPARASASPDEPWVVYVSAWRLHAAGKHLDAGRLLDKRLTTTDLEPWLLRLLGDVRLAEGRAAEAAEAWRAAAKLYPHDPGIYRRLAGVWPQVKGLDPVFIAERARLAKLELQAETAPVDAWASALAAGCVLARKDLDRAEVRLFGALLAAPRNSAAEEEAFAAWSSILKKRGRSAAVADFLARRRDLEEDPARRGQIDEQYRAWRK